MIPYALLMMDIKFKDNKNLETRILNPIMDGVSFRVAKKWDNEIKTNIEELIFYFLDYKNKKYDQIIIKEFEIERIDDEYEVHTENKDFQKRLSQLIKDYSRYIELKTEYEETEVIEEIATNKIINNEVKLDIPIKKTDIAISLDTIKAYKDFLSKDINDFLKDYWKENGLENHPVTEQKITHLYIGNQFCSFLLPDLETLEKVISKANELELKPVIVFSTMSENRIDFYKSVISSLPANTELVINDLGMLRMLKDDKQSFDITLGTLMVKRKKDSRAFISEENKDTSIDADFYRDYLKSKLGVNRFSYEVCDYEICISEKNSVLHLPLYQMNTSGHCTLAALCQFGERGHQVPQKNCPHYCEEVLAVYSKESGIIGRWNSLFGCSKREINNFELLNKMIEDGIGRLVIRG